MKKLLILLLPAILTILSCNQNQTDYQIVIRTNGSEFVDKMYLFTEIGFIMDSTTIKNGEFDFSGFLTEPQLCVVSPEKNPGLGKLFILNNGRTIIEGNLKNFPESEISFENKTNNELFLKFKDQFSNYNNHVYQISPKLKKAKEQKDTIKIKSYTDSLSILAKEQRRIIFSFVGTNPNNAGIAIAIAEELIPSKYLKIDEFIKVYELYTQNIKESFYGRKLKEYIEDQISPPMKVGEQVIDFTMENIEENPVSISDFRNKYVLIDFWASWCAPCRAENPNLKRAYDKYNTNGFEIVGISLDTDKEAWKRAIEKDELNWINLSDFKGWESELTLKYKIKSVPSNMLLDKTGRIIAVEIRGNELQKILEQIFEK